MNIIEELTSLVPKLLQRYDVPGAAVAVINNGTVAWTLGYGLADVENRVPVSAETVFQGIERYALIYLVGEAGVEPATSSV